MNSTKTQHSLSKSDIEFIRSKGSFGWKTLSGNRGLRSRFLPRIRVKKGRTAALESQVWHRTSTTKKPVSKSVVVVPRLKTAIRFSDGDVVCPHCDRWQYETFVPTGECKCIHCWKEFEVLAPKPQRRSFSSIW